MMNTKPSKTRDGKGKAQLILIRLFLLLNQYLTFLISRLKFKLQALCIESGSKLLRSLQITITFLQISFKSFLDKYKGPIQRPEEPPRFSLS